MGLGGFDGRVGLDRQVLWGEWDLAATTKTDTSAMAADQISDAGSVGYGICWKRMQD